MQFKHIAGQAAVKQRLINTVNDNRVSHAQLFLGPEGSGAWRWPSPMHNICRARTGSRMIPAAYVLPAASTRNWHIPTCIFPIRFLRKIKTILLLALLNNGAKPCWPIPTSASISGVVTSMPKTSRPISTLPSATRSSKTKLQTVESAYKILILWLPEYLDKEGNSLLKIIEEPQPNTLFLLVAQNQDQILNTILSRTQLVKIPALSYDEIKTELMQNHNQTEFAAAEIAYLSNGNLTEALAMLQQENKSYHTLFVQWLRLCFSNKGLEVMPFVDQVSKMGRENQKNFLRYGISFIRECCLLMSGAAAWYTCPRRSWKRLKK